MLLLRFVYFSIYTSELTFIDDDISTLSAFTSLKLPSHVISECGVNPSLQDKGDSFPSLSIALTAKYNLLPFVNLSIVISVLSTISTSICKLPI